MTKVAAKSTVLHIRVSFASGPVRMDVKGQPFASHAGTSCMSWIGLAGDWWAPGVSTYPHAAQHTCFQGHIAKKAWNHLEPMTVPNCPLELALVWRNCGGSAFLFKMPSLSHIIKIYQHNTAVYRHFAGKDVCKYIHSATLPVSILKRYSVNCDWYPSLQPQSMKGPIKFS